MAINYAEKYSKTIDERFTQASITERAINKDFDFVGVQTVKVYSVPTVAMGDYKRQGAQRYGVPEELQNTVQEMTMGRDRAFTFTVDKGNEDETSGALNAGKALSRQINEVIVPEVDAYRLAKIVHGAGHVEIGDYKGNIKAYERILDAQAALDDALVPRAGRILYVTSALRKAIMMDDNFIKPSEMAQKMLINGQFGEVDGLPIILAPAGYLPSGVSMLLTHPQATTAPYKLAEYKTHMDPPGINGVLVEGRNYYDAFILNNKRKCIYVLRSELVHLNVSAAAGSASGKTVITVTGDKDEAGQMGALCYKSGASQSEAQLGDDVSAWTELPQGGEIAATSGHKIAVALRDGKGRAIGSGIVTAI